MEDNETQETSETGLGKQVGKSFLVNTAGSAGIYAGFALSMLAGGLIKNALKDRKAKKNPIEN